MNLDLPVFLVYASAGDVATNSMIQLSMPDKVNVVSFLNNKKGLSSVYNQAIVQIDKQILEQDDAIIIFVHDDVSIQDSMFCNKLARALQSYDIIGLAGGSLKKNWGHDDYPLWHLMTDRHSGIVAHPTESDGALTSVCFGPTPRDVDVVDGLFIATKLSVLRTHNLTWDERFNFHFYDLAFCMRANSKGCNIGTWPIWVVHQGLGDSFQSDEWRNNRDKFIKAYYNK